MSIVSTIVCRACGKLVTINADGAYRVHGRRNRRCWGNYRCTHTPPHQTVEACVAARQAATAEERAR